MLNPNKNSRICDPGPIICYHNRLYGYIQMERVIHDRHFIICLRSRVDGMLFPYLGRLDRVIDGGSLYVPGPSVLNVENPVSAACHGRWAVFTFVRLGGGGGSLPAGHILFRPPPGGGGGAAGSWGLSLLLATLFCYTAAAWLNNKFYVPLYQRSNRISGRNRREYDDATIKDELAAAAWKLIPTIILVETPDGKLLSHLSGNPAARNFSMEQSGNALYLLLRPATRQLHWLHFISNPRRKPSLPPRTVLCLSQDRKKSSSLRCPTFRLRPILLSSFGQESEGEPS